jgi:hypothetical protein
MRASALAALSLVVFSGHSAAQTPAPPPPPQVTVGAGLKLLQFDWEPAPRASFYLLLHKPDAASPFAVHGNPILAPRARATLTIPVHTLDWENARYKVLACNESGCPNSPELGVQDLMLPSIGYVKASNPDPFDGFGRFVVLSQDGNTLVTSSHDDSNAVGVYADQSDNSSEDSGAVYVFRRVGASWKQEVFIKAGTNQPQQYFGIGYPVGHRALAVSGNGMLVAVGAPGEFVNGVEKAGAVYLFSRLPQGGWTQQGDALTLPSPGVLDFFGVSVDLNSDGTLLKVTSLGPFDPSLPMGTTHVYQRTDTGWVQYAWFPPEPGDLGCGSQMSADADAIVAVCNNAVTGPVIRARHHRYRYWWRVQDIPLPSYHPQQPALSGNSARMAVLTSTAAGVRMVNVYGWTGSAWVLEAQLTSPGGTATDYPSWGEALAFNRNGTLLALGDYSNSSGGAGVSNAPLPPGTPPANKHGAVFVYRREASGWTLSRVVKAPSPQHFDSFGRNIALSGNGLTMAIGAPSEDSAARGIDGNQADNSKLSAGAIYLY